MRRISGWSILPVIPDMNALRATTLGDLVISTAAVAAVVGDRQPELVRHGLDLEAAGFAAHSHPAGSWLDETAPDTASR